MRLRKVTITGADDSIQPVELFVLKQKYPFVEWALLLSSKSQGFPRFPSGGWLHDLNSIIKYPPSRIPPPLSTKLELSGHFCGKLVSNFVRGKLPDESEMEPWIFDMFQRIQINFHGIPQTPTPEFYQDLPTQLKNSGKQYIFQADGVNETLFWGMLRRNVDAVPLFDLSHGGGVLPEDWPKPFPNVMCGYAGGLGPNNLQQQLEKISALVGDHPIWIDMETNVRSDNDLQFDLEKVEACLKIAAPYVE